MSHKVLHLLLLESLIHTQRKHPLKGRLTALTVIAATMLLTFLEGSKGAWIVEPDPLLIGHYARFGFTPADDDENVMYATTETLQSVQTALLNTLRNSNT